MIKKPITDPPQCTSNIIAMTDALEVFGGKWRLLIIHYLTVRKDEINTFKKIEKDIQGISAKMLSKELKALEVNNIISRTVMNTKPITVQYNITEYGMSTQSVIQALVSWGLNHRLTMFNPEKYLNP